MPFIVLEGLDGAGKSTQVKLIQDTLTSQGMSFEYLHFPRFDTPVYGELIARFLRGELGSVDQVSPYLVALIYAGDRLAAAADIRRWLDEGKYVIADRYVYSNVAYQCAKIGDSALRDELREWIVDMEYVNNAIPRPDMSLFLDVPFSFTQASLEKQREGDDRGYLNGKEDIHEASLDLQQRVREVYLAQSELDDKFRIVSCADADGNMLPAQLIYMKIITELGLNA